MRFTGLGFVGAASVGGCDDGVIDEVDVASPSNCWLRVVVAVVEVVSGSGCADFGVSLSLSSSSPQVRSMVTPCLLGGGGDNGRGRERSAGLMHPGMLGDAELTAVVVIIADT